MPDPKANLTQGTRYRGRIVIFYPVAPDSLVKSKLGEAGFTDIILWSDQEKLPADWPKEAREDVADIGYTQVYVEGTWGKPTGLYPSSGSDWQLYDYWPKDAAKPLTLNEPPTSNWKTYVAIAGGALVLGVLLIVVTKD